MSGETTAAGFPIQLHDAETGKFTGLTFKAEDFGGLMPDRGDTIFSLLAAPDPQRLPLGGHGAFDVVRRCYMPDAKGGGVVKLLARGPRPLHSAEKALWAQD